MPLGVEPHLVFVSWREERGTEPRARGPLASSQLWLGPPLALPTSPCSLPLAYIRGPVLKQLLLAYIDIHLQSVQR